MEELDPKECAVKTINKRISDLKGELLCLEGKSSYYSDRKIRFQIEGIKKTLTSNYEMLEFVLRSDTLFDQSQESL